MASTIKYHMLTIWPYQGGGLCTPEGSIKVYTEAATQSFVYGAPLVYDTSETDVKLATDTTVAGIGLALSPAVASGGNVTVHLFNPNTLYSAPVLNAGAAAANAAAQVGVKYSWVARTDGLGYGIDTADTSSHDWFQVVALHPDYPAGSNPGYVLVRVLDAVRLTVIVA